MDKFLGFLSGDWDAKETSEGRDASTSAWQSVYSQERMHFVSGSCERLVDGRAVYKGMPVSLSEG